MEEITYSLSELNHAIQEIIEGNFEEAVVIKAEISSFSQSSRGHCYFELIEKQAGRVIAKSRANLWASIANKNLDYFEKVNGRPLKNGDEVLLHIKVRFHPQYGISLDIKKIDPTYTLGKRAQDRAAIEARLIKEGLMKANKAFEMPKIIQKIAVISSKNAAGYQDFMEQLSKNEEGYVFKTVLFNSLMQGDMAPHQIQEQLYKIGQLKTVYDVVVIIRGGGADTDLDCFSTYEVGAAIGQADYPVVTGIGHEQDVSIADLCAHTSLKTPTAVATFIIEQNRTAELEAEALFYEISTMAEDILLGNKQFLTQFQSTLHLKVNKIIQNDQQRMEQIRFEIIKNARQVLVNQKQICQQFKSQLTLTVPTIFKQADQAMNNQIIRLKEISRQVLNSANTTLNHFEMQTNIADPINILKRGFNYAKVKNQFIKSAEQMKSIKKARLHFHDGSIDIIKEEEKKN